MSDEKDAFIAAQRATQTPQALRVLHRALAIDQASNGSVGIRMPDAGAPSETAKPMPLWLGLPGFAVRMKQGTELEVGAGFFAGAESGGFAALFPFFPQSTPEAPLPLPFDSVDFGGGDKPIARVDDAATCDSIILTNLPPGPGGVPTGILITQRTYAGRDVAGPELILGTIAGPIAVAPSPLTITLSALITSGREEFRA